MDRFHAMRTFVRVVDSQGFSRAAQALSLPRSSVTSLVKQLEAHLGFALLQRTTRSLSLTDRGEQYYRHCMQWLAELDAFEEQLRDTGAAPRGRVRIDMTAALARALVWPRLKGFQQRFPEIELILSLSDKPIDMVGEGVDCVIRSGQLPDSSLIAKPLGALQWITCAATTYLDGHGIPQAPEDLSQHRIINYQAALTGRPRAWQFQQEQQTRSVDFAGQLCVNDTEAYLHCALEGLGLVQLSEFLARPYLQSGRLREVLAAFRTPPVPVSVLFAQGRNLPQATRVFIAWLEEQVERTPLFIQT
ncbi:LysR family transcriptional regulator [Pseudomonas gingeri NCPPB 3146 = LMG 5327]|uniref:LysR family transcriptional regulator n=2 Tax=Pseudomonas gingeri TaxID=117681 RepID=A0A7Y7XX02_9PSED|nr:LysR family transcriptional regulator [Pseudomonas gingeri]NWC12908.1 LysR family transcriptional regulator [Pseudomonas gingeri]NWE67695.1 LysR family transcriptional regulator [Pseudomonas gingeri]PNQ94415.1 LysR family transcriptional regulator [Pseudomonas gingeri NCPPB 3146 = LMG 5327]